MYVTNIMQPPKYTKQSKQKVLKTFLHFEEITKQS